MHEVLSWYIDVRRFKNVVLRNFEKKDFRSQLIDNYDGSYVFRIRLWSSCSRIILNIHTAEGVALCNSPIILEKGLFKSLAFPDSRTPNFPELLQTILSFFSPFIREAFQHDLSSFPHQEFLISTLQLSFLANGRLLYSEYCDCPDKNILEWMKEAGCSTEHQQLDSDLSKWSRIDFKKVLSTVKLKWISPQQRYSVALCHYQIIDNDVSILLLGFLIFAEHFNI